MSDYKMTAAEKDQKMNGSTDSAMPPIDDAPEGALTYWDKVNLGRWGRYIAEIEKTGILRAHELSGKPSAGLDLGCGSGQWSHLLSTLGWHMTCVDVDRDALSICRRNVPKANYILTDCNARTIPGNSGSAGLLLCIEAPLLDSDWFLAETDRILNKGGLLVGVWWNSRSLRGMAWRLKQNLKTHRDATCFYTSSYSSWKKRLAMARFEMLYENGFCWGPFSRSSDSSLIPGFSALERILCLNRWLAFSPWIIFVAKKAAA
jgi:SAM-dependent methyltransferase